MKWLDEQAAYLKKVGPTRYWAMIVGTVLFVLIWTFSEIWVSGQIGWPEAYGVHCYRKCLLPWIWNSPKLLLDGSVPAIAMFALLWLPPAAFLWVISKLARNPKSRKRM
jgi:hypothetical protein